MKKLFILSLGFLVSIMVLMTPSCTKDYLIPVEIDIPDTVSFSQYIIPIFNDNCNNSGCHNTGAIAPDLTSANAWSDLWLYGFVDTTNPESSTLYKRMVSTSSPMPPNGKLPGGEDQLVLEWIRQGALDN